MDDGRLKAEMVLYQNRVVADRTEFKYSLNINIIYIYEKKLCTALTTGFTSTTRSALAVKVSFRLDKRFTNFRTLPAAVSSCQIGSHPLCSSFLR